ncbi:pentapeptide repeat-containing protein [Nonomuraea rubra]
MSKATPGPVSPPEIAGKETQPLFPTRMTIQRTAPLYASLRLLLWAIPVCLLSVSAVIFVDDAIRPAALVVTLGTITLTSIIFSARARFLANSTPRNSVPEPTDTPTGATLLETSDLIGAAYQELGHTSLATRMAALYKLRLLVGDSAEKAPLVFDVLMDFVRQQTHIKPTTRQDQLKNITDDVQLALTMLSGLRRARLVPDSVTLNFSNLNLRGAHLEDANLAGVDFRGARLDGSRFRSCTFDRANLNNTSLVFFRGIQSSFRSALMEKADLRGAILIGANFDGALVSTANFARANLRQASFKHAVLAASDFSHADVDGADFTDAMLAGAKMDAAAETQASFTDSDRRDLSTAQ